MPRKLTFKKSYYVPSFKQLTKSLNCILPNIPILDSQGNRPLKMTFEDHLNALIFFHLEEHVSARHLVQTLHVKILPQKAVLAQVRSRKPLTTVALNNLWLFFNNFKNKPVLFCLKNTPNQENLFQLTDHLLTLFCQWLGMSSYYT